jgi:poly(beta-D-mannuronate) lyase
MDKLSLSIIVTSLALGSPTISHAKAAAGMFDSVARYEQLKSPDFSEVRQFCLKFPIDEKWKDLKPIDGLTGTVGYGSDTKAEDFSWAVMVLSGRSLAGDKNAQASLIDLMSRWAKAEAFSKTEEVNDAYYALKRQLLPLSVAYGILQPSLSVAQDTQLRSWIDPLVRKIDKIFDGDVDKNNHRTLADSVLAVWGATIGDEAMLSKGLSRYDTVLSETRFDGTLELEARRGARALWYQRQTLSSLIVLAETARGNGKNLYERSSANGQNLATLIGAMMNGITAPTVVTVYSSENHIPGPEKNFLKPDLGFLETRPHARHYMAWTEAAVVHGNGLAYQRLKILFDRDIAQERPLIDEFSGGNATCFWRHP